MRSLHKLPLGLGMLVSIEFEPELREAFPTWGYRVAYREMVSYLRRLLFITKHKRLRGTLMVLSSPLRDDIMPSFHHGVFLIILLRFILDSNNDIGWEGKLMDVDAWCVVALTWNVLSPVCSSTIIMDKHINLTM